VAALWPGLQLAWLKASSGFSVCQLGENHQCAIYQWRNGENNVSSISNNGINISRNTIQRINVTIPAANLMKYAMASANQPISLYQLSAKANHG
jgi:hypothetical protein